MSLITEQAAFLKDVRKLLGFAETQGLTVTAGELERKPEMQAIYVKSGYEKTMDSMHLRKCAIDLTFFTDSNDDLQLVQDAERLKPIGSYWESLDQRNRWGGNGAPPLDLPHFERSLGAWPSKSAGTLEAPADAPRPLAAAAAGDVRPSAVMATMRASGSTPELPSLKRGSSDRNAVTRLQTLLVSLKRLDKADGNFDDRTAEAVAKFQRDNNLVADGVVGEKTWTTLLGATSSVQKTMSDRWLGDADLAKAATDLNLELAALKAVYKVESNGAGFVGDRAKILFEGHIFWQQLKAHGLKPETFATGNETILYPKWTKAFYVGGGAEWNRLEKAESIQREAALESASWGLFQIMGYHWKPLSYASVDEFTNCMGRHERDQLEAFCRFIKINKAADKRSLLELLQAKDWAAFAYSYNGPKYRENAYDDKLREAYRGFCA